MIDLTSSVSLVSGNSSGGSLFAWSPNGRYTAVVSAKQCRLVIRDSMDLQVIRSEVIAFEANHHQQQAEVDKLEFSPDSEFILCSSLKSGVTCVVRVLASDWKARITEPPDIADAFFSPDSRHVITIAQFNVKMTVWSFTEKRIRYIKLPRVAGFRPNQSSNGSVDHLSTPGEDGVGQLAVIESHSNQDTLSLFSTRTWEIDRHFVTKDFKGTSTCTMGISGMKWHPKGDVVCLFADKLDYDLRVYSVNTHTNKPGSQHLRCLMSYTPDDDVTRGMGLRSLEWSPCGSLLLAGGGDGTIQVFNAVNWSLVSQLEVLDCKIDADGKTNVYEEQQIDVDELDSCDGDIDALIAQEWTAAADLSDTGSGGMRKKNRLLDTRYLLVEDRPVQLVPSAATTISNSGVTKMSFSPDGLYLAVCLGSLPAVVFIWDVLELSLQTVIVNRQKVTDTQWSPTGRGHSNRLLVLTQNSSMLHCWTPTGVACLSLPKVNKLDNYTANSLQWNPRGKSVALISKQSVVVCQVGGKESDNSTRRN